MSLLASLVFKPVMTVQANQTGVAYLSPRTIGLHAEAEMKWPKHWHVQTIELGSMSTHTALRGDSGT
jgi:hypothetical protein